MKRRNLIEVPDKVQIFVFGSVLHKLRTQANDIDIIVIYDLDFYPNLTIFNACKDVINAIQKIIKLRPHVTYLSELEEQHSHFVIEVGAIPLISYLASLEEAE